VGGCRRKDLTANYLLYPFTGWPALDNGLSCPVDGYVLVASTDGQLAG
jgi:hypothetical protein